LDNFWFSNSANFAPVGKLVNHLLVVFKVGRFQGNINAKGCAATNKIQVGLKALCLVIEKSKITRRIFQGSANSLSTDGD